MSIQTTAPAPLAPVPFNIPAAFEQTLENGLRVVIFDDERLPLVSYRLVFFCGDAYDPKGHNGITSAMASVMTEGTENHSSLQLAEKIERLGASLHVGASDDFLSVSASALTMYSSEILDLIAEVVFRPTFPEEELDLYRRNTVEHLKFQRSQPTFLANEQTARILYGDHPYATISPSAKDIEQLTRDNLIKLHGERLIPNNAVFIAVGDVDRDALMSEVESHFGAWEKGEAVSIEHVPPPVRAARSITLVDRPGSAQSNIIMSQLSVDRSHPDYFPIIVMNQVLGAGASSRVFMNLREEKGYTYGAYTRFDMKRFGGEFEATAEVRTAVTGDSIKEFFYELERIRNESVTDTELADAKAYLAGVFPIRAETQEGKTGLIVNQQLYGLPSDYLQTYRDNINAVTIEEVQRVANEQIRPESIAMVVVGDAGEIIPQVIEFADEIEVFDTDGNRKELSDLESESGEPADLTGKWMLTLDFQGQSVPVTLHLEEQGSSVAGRLETMLGDGEITEVSIDGSKFTAVAVSEMQGEALELSIRGKVTGGAMSGSISAPILPEVLTFTGTRT